MGKTRLYIYIYIHIYIYIILYIYTINNRKRKRERERERALQLDCTVFVTWTYCLGALKNLRSLEFVVGWSYWIYGYVVGNWNLNPIRADQYHWHIRIEPNCESWIVVSVGRFRYRNSIASETSKRDCILPHFQSSTSLLWDSCPTSKWLPQVLWVCKVGMQKHQGVEPAMRTLSWGQQNMIAWMTTSSLFFCIFWVAVLCYHIDSNLFI